jgi:hypothetical protein
MQRPGAGDCQRQPGAAPPADDARAHTRERFHDPVHRAAAERLVPGQHGRERLARQHAHQEPRGRPGVPAVHYVARLREAVESRALDHEVPGSLPGHLRAERRNCPERPQTVLPLEEPLDLGETIGERPQECGPM